MDNEKHQKSTTGNYRNGHGRKKIKSSFGESEIKIPKDREGNLEPALVPKDTILSTVWKTSSSHSMQRNERIRH
nr:transposase [Chryseobacterium sp.]